VGQSGANRVITRQTYIITLTKCN